MNEAAQAMAACDVTFPTRWRIKGIMAKKKRTRSRAPRRQAGSGRSLGNLSMDALQKELEIRERQTQSQIHRLQKKRNAIREQLADLEAQIIELGGKLSGIGGRKRPKNSMNLADALVKVLKTATMSVTEVSEAVQHAGYKTTSPNFRTIVNQTLIKDKRFKRVSRGQYTAR